MSADSLTRWKVWAYKSGWTAAGQWTLASARRRDIMPISTSLLKMSKSRQQLARCEASATRTFPRDDTRPWNFVLGDEAEHEIDFHVIAIDEYGRGVYGPLANGEFYPAEALAGTGVINGRIVACVTPEWLVKVHTGYELHAKDWSDVSVLCERFGIQVPAEHQRFGQPEASSRDERHVNRYTAAGRP